MPICMQKFGIAVGYEGGWYLWKVSRAAVECYVNLEMIVRIDSRNVHGAAVLLEDLRI